MASRSELVSREFVGGIRELRDNQRRLQRGRHGRSGAALRSYFTNNNTATKGQMKTAAVLRETPIDQREMLLVLWEIVRTM